MALDFLKKKVDVQGTIDRAVSSSGGQSRLPQLGKLDVGGTQTSTPQTTQQDPLKMLQKVGETGVSLGEGLFKAASQPKETSEALSAGFVQGTPAAVSAGQTSISRLIKKGAEGLETAVETANLPGQLAEFITKGEIQAPEFDAKIFRDVSKTLEDESEENRELANTLARMNMPVEDERTLNQKLKDPEFLFKNLIGQNAPNLLVSAGVGAAGFVVGGPIGGMAAAFSSAATLEGGFAINEAKGFLENHEDENMQELANDDEFLNNVGVSVGLINGVLETLPITKVLNRNPAGGMLKRQIIKQATRGVVGQAATEGGTESVQEIISNSIAQVYDQNRGTFEGVAEAAIAGGLLGGGTTLAQDVGAGVAREVQRRGGVPGLSLEDVSGETPQAETLETVAQQRNDMMVIDTGRTFNGEPVKTVSTDALLAEDVAGVKAEDSAQIQKVSEQIEAGQDIDPIIVEVADGTIFVEDGKHRLEAARLKGLEFIDVIEKPARTKRPASAQKVLGREQSPFVRRRETTLLKDRVRTLARGFKEGRRATKQEVKQVQTEALALVDKLPARDRDKFRRTIKNIQTPEQLEKRLPEIEERVDSLLQKDETRKLRNDIRKKLKTTKTRKQAGKPVGKFTPDIQKTLDVLRDASKLKREDAEARIQKNLETFKDEIPPAEVAMENAVLQMVADMDSMDTETLRKLDDEITDLIENGRMINALRKFNREEQNDRNKAMAIDVITGGAGVPEGINTRGVQPLKGDSLLSEAKKWMKSAGRTIIGWQDILDTISGKDKSEPFRSRLNNWANIEPEKSVEKQGKDIFMQRIRDLAFAELGVETDRQLTQKFRDDSVEHSLGEFKNAQGKIVEIKFTRAEARKRWMELKDPSLRETFQEGMGYTPEIIFAIDSFLTTADKRFALKQMEFYREYYATVNDIYREIYGVDLPFNEFYSPIARDGISREDSSGFGELLQEVPVRRSLTTGSLKSRVENIKPIKRQSDTAVLEQHLAEMEHFKAFATKLRELNSVFGDPDVRAVIKEEYGTGVLAIIDNFIQDFTRGGVDSARNIGWIDKLRGNMSRSVLAIKPAIGIKQLTSTVAYAERMPVGTWMKNNARFFKSPIKNTQFLLKNSPMLRARGQNMERDVRVAMKSDAMANYRRNPSFLNKLMLNVQMGDQGAIVSGGWAYYTYLVEQKGMSHEDAIAEFETFTSNTQQSSDLDVLSYMQRGGTFHKLFTMFLSAPNLYFRKELGAVRNLLRGRGSKAQHAKTLAIYHFILPMIFQYVSDLGEWDPEEQRRAAILGSLNGIFIVGDGLDYVLRKGLGMKAWEPKVSLWSIVDDTGKFAKIIDDEDITDEDVINAMEGLLGASGQISGVPLESAFNMSRGGLKILGGDYAKGIAEMMGWTPFRSERRFQDEGITVPEVDVPEVEIPEVETPEVNIPNVNI